MTNNCCNCRYVPCVFKSWNPSAQLDWYLQMQGVQNTVGLPEALEDGYGEMEGVGEGSEQVEG